MMVPVKNRKKKGGGEKAYIRIRIKKDDLRAPEGPKLAPGFWFIHAA